MVLEFSGALRCVFRLRDVDGDLEGNSGRTNKEVCRQFDEVINTSKRRSFVKMSICELVKILHGIDSIGFH